MADFSTVLTTDLTTSDEIAYVQSNVGARTTYPWRAVIDAEVIYVTAGVAEGLVWSIERGADDSDSAEHPAGSTLNAIRMGEFGGSSIETPTPAPGDGNRVFYTLRPYATGSLTVFVDNIDQTAAVTETDPTTGAFTLAFDPRASEQILCSYQER